MVSLFLTFVNAFLLGCSRSNSRRGSRAAETCSARHVNFRDLCGWQCKPDQQNEQQPLASAPCVIKILFVVPDLHVVSQEKRTR